MQESVEVETKSIQLLTKMLPIIEHHVSTAFGVRKEFCNGRRATLAKAGQGNAFLVRTCIDPSRMPLRETEK